MNAGAAPFGHGPAFTAFAIKRDVDGAVVERIYLIPPPGEGPGVVGGKDAANEGDDAQGVLAVIADRVDIPPEIRPSLDRLVESRSAITVAAANRPEIAAIGTPGPGCTLPPVR